MRLTQAGAACLFVLMAACSAGVTDGPQVPPSATRPPGVTATEPSAASPRVPYPLHTATSADQSSLPACTGAPVLDRLPLALDDFRAFRPLGFTSVPIHIMPARFSAFSRSLPGETRPPAAIVFPGDAWVTQVLTTEFPTTGARGFQITFSPCRHLKLSFNHIGSLSERLPAGAAGSPPDELPRVRFRPGASREDVSGEPDATGEVG